MRTPSPATFELAASEAGGELTVVVRDRGQWRGRRERAHGRGMKIIAEAMDTVELRTDDGTEVLMRRTLRPMTRLADLEVSNDGRVVSARIIRRGGACPTPTS